MMAFSINPLGEFQKGCWKIYGNKNVLDMLTKSKYLISTLTGHKHGKKFVLIKFAVLLIDAFMGIIGIVVLGLFINE